MGDICQIHQEHDPSESARSVLHDVAASTLMNTFWHSLRSQTALGTLLVAALERYGETANAAADASMKVIRSCDELYGQLDELLNIVNHEIKSQGVSFPIDEEEMMGRWISFSTAPNSSLPLIIVPMLWLHDPRVSRPGMQQASICGKRSICISIPYLPPLTTCLSAVNTKAVINQNPIRAYRVFHLRWRLIHLNGTPLSAYSIR